MFYPRLYLVEFFTIKRTARLFAERISIRHHRIGHLGYATGASRSAFQEPGSAAVDVINTQNDPYNLRSGDLAGNRICSIAYEVRPLNLPDRANAIFDAISTYLDTPSGDFRLRPGTLNAWIAGYKGYYELAKLAGYADTSSEVANARNTYNSLLSQRAANFYKNPPWSDSLDALNYWNMNPLNVASNFMWLTPELGQYLHDHILSQVQDAYLQYVYVAPHWFMNNFEATFMEHTMHHNWDSPSLFAAKAYILKHSREELAKYLDSPACIRGDLFYINNLLTVLEAGSAILPPGNLKVSP
jgi:hypothetical protein